MFNFKTVHKLKKDVIIQHTYWNHSIKIKHQKLLNFAKSLFFYKNNLNNCYLYVHVKL